MKKEVGRLVLIIFAIFLLSAIPFASALTLNDVGNFFSDIYNNLQKRVTGYAIYAESGCYSGTVLYLNGEGLNDSSGFGNNVVKSKVTFKNGILGNGFYFDGKNSFLEIKDSQSLSTKDAVSISAWVYLSKLPTSKEKYYTIISKSAFTNSLLVDSSGKLQFYLDTKNRLVSKGKISLNKWTHVLFTFDGKNAQFYINGKKDKAILSYKSKKALVVNKLPLRIGEETTSNYAYPFNGRSDEIAVFNRALSLGEIAEIYNSGIGKPICSVENLPLKLSLDFPKNGSVNAIDGEMLIEASTNRDAACSYGLFQQVSKLELSNMQKTGGKKHTQLITELQNNQNYILVVECSAGDKTVRNQTEFKVSVPVLRGKMGILIDNEIYGEGGQIKLVK
jgi:hypothetical protein